MRKAELRSVVAAAYHELGSTLGKDVTDGMAIPSYVEGIFLSRFLFWRKLHYIIKAARLRPDSRVLDFGCGTGILLPQLSADGRTVTATDLHPEIAQDVVQRLNLTRVEFLPVDAWQTAMADGAIETIIAANVLEHIDDRRELLNVLGRKLTLTGRLVISGPTENLMYRFGRRLIGFSGNYHVTTIRDILDDARAAGLRQVYLKRFPAPGPFCLYKIAVFQQSTGDGCLR